MIMGGGGGGGGSDISATNISAKDVLVTKIKYIPFVPADEIQPFTTLQ